MWLLLFAACHYNPESANGDPADDEPGPDAGVIVDPGTATCGVGGTALCIEFEDGATEYDAMHVALDGSGFQNDAVATAVVSMRRRVLPAVADDRAAGLGLTSKLTVGSDIGVDQSFTVEAWVQLAANLVIDRHWLLDSNGRFFVSVDDLTGSVRCGINYTGTDNAALRLDSRASIDYQWHHVACSFDKATKVMTIYVDGSSQDCKTLASTITPAAGATTIGVPHVGARSSDHLLGSLDSVRVYDHALDPTAICSLAGGGSCQVQCSPNSDGGLGGGFGGH